MLGLNPGESDAPQKIWKVVSAYFLEMKRHGYDENNPPGVDSTFSTTGQEDVDEPPRAFVYYNSRDEWDLDEVRKNCAALAHLGFDILTVWRES